MPTATPESPHPARSLPPERRGFRVLYEPASVDQAVNLVLVHGLRGSSIGTWTYSEGESKVFWPTFLREDVRQRFSNLRIATFGYDADIRFLFGPANVVGIEGIAKQLLDALDTEYHKSGYVPALILQRIERTDLQRPTILLVHSMGGLVAKKVTGSKDTDVMLNCSRWWSMHTTTPHTTKSWLVYDRSFS